MYTTRLNQNNGHGQTESHPRNMRIWLIALLVGITCASVAWRIQSGYDDDDSDDDDDDPLRMRIIQWGYDNDAPRAGRHWSSPPCPIRDQHVFVLNGFEVMRPWLQSLGNHSPARTLRTLPFHGAMAMYAMHATLEHTTWALKHWQQWIWNCTLPSQTWWLDMAVWLSMNSINILLPHPPVLRTRSHQIHAEAVIQRWLAGNTSDAQWAATACAQDMHVFRNAWLSIDVLIYIGILVAHLSIHPQGSMLICYACFVTAMHWLQPPLGGKLLEASHIILLPWLILFCRHLDFNQLLDLLIAFIVLCL